MAFSQMNLAVLAFANGFTLWHYRARERPVAPGSAATGRRPVETEGRWLTADEVMAPGHFAAAAGTLARGDMLICQCADGRVVTLLVAGEPGRRTVPGEAIDLVSLTGPFSAPLPGQVSGASAPVPQSAPVVPPAPSPAPPVPVPAPADPPQPPPAADAPEAA